MKKFRCLKNYMHNGPQKGDICQGDYTWGNKEHTVTEMAKLCPEDWEFVEEDKSFPREMLVWDCYESDAVKQTVLSIFPERDEYPIITIDSVYSYAKELPETPKEVELTIEDIAEKFNVDPKLIRIKK